MIYPMRRFALNNSEALLALTGNVVAIVMILFGVGAIIVQIWFPGRWLDIGNFIGGLLVMLTLAAGALLALGSGGVRQNRGALDMALTLMLLAALGWLLPGVLGRGWGYVATGAALLAMLLVCWLLRREGVRSRFRPRFMTLRQFETTIQIADVMIDDEQRLLSPIEIAIRTDHFLAVGHSPTAGQIRLVLILVEWLLPLMIFRPIPFSDLGTNERRRVIEKVIWSRGIFRDVARTLKLLAAFSYYTDENVRRGMGYTDFDGRSRAQGKSQAPATYPLPTTKREVTP